MSSSRGLNSISLSPIFDHRLVESCWYAVHTMARHEKRIDGLLREKGLVTFLPTFRQTHRWSDRHQTVEVPMFGCYAFVSISQSTEERLKVLRTPGVLAFVGSEGRGTPIPEEQIESLRTAVSQRLPCSPYPFISAGRRVRIRGGSLEGVEGILVHQDEDQNLVVSVELLQRSVAIRVEGYDLESI